MYKIKILNINDEYIINNTEKLNLSNKNNYTFYKMKNKNLLLKISQLPTKEEEKLVDELIKRQSLIKTIDFPLGKVYKKNKYIGQILKYYDQSITIRELLKTYNLNEIKKIYNKSENKIDNLFFLLNEIIEIIEEANNHNITICDIHSKNILIHNNKIKIIDFDPKYTHFEKNIHYNYSQINNFNVLTKEILSNYLLQNTLKNEKIELNIEYTKERLTNLKKEIKKYIH